MYGQGGQRARSNSEQAAQLFEVSLPREWAPTRGVPRQQPPQPEQSQRAGETRRSKTNTNQESAFMWLEQAELADPSYDITHCTVVSQRPAEARVHGG